MSNLKCPFFGDIHRIPYRRNQMTVTVPRDSRTGLGAPDCQNGHAYQQKNCAAFHKANVLGLEDIFNYHNFQKQLSLNRS